MLCQVSLWDGVTMGGGVGLSLHGSAAVNLRLTTCAAATTTTTTTTTTPTTTTTTTITTTTDNNHTHRHHHHDNNDNAQARFGWPQRRLCSPCRRWRSASLLSYSRVVVYYVTGVRIVRLSSSSVGWVGPCSKYNNND